MSLSDPTIRADDQPDTENAVLAGARERVISLLTDRLASGTLTQDEFESRLERLHAARTPSELNGLMRDLVGQPSAPVATAGGSDAAGYDRHYDAAAVYGRAPATGRLLAILSETKRSGRWVVPRRLEMRVIMGEVLIDLREAVLPAEEI